MDLDLAERVQMEPIRPRLHLRSVFHGYLVGKCLERNSRLFQALEQGGFSLRSNGVVRRLRMCRCCLFGYIFLRGLRRRDLCGEPDVIAALHEGANKGGFT